MARVRVEPSGIELEVPAGVTIMQAARDAGYYWPNQCDMQCRCSNCSSSRSSAWSTGRRRCRRWGRRSGSTLREQRGRRALEQPVRLGCQTSVTGDVVIHKIGVYVDPFA